MSTRDCTVEMPVDFPFKPMTKDEMLNKLAMGRRQIENEKSKDSETMEKELAKEFGF